MANKDKWFVLKYFGAILLLVMTIFVLIRLLYWW